MTRYSKTTQPVPIRLPRALVAELRSGEEDVTSGVRNLIGCGMIDTMANAEPRVDPYFIEELRHSTFEGIVQEYLKWLEAVRLHVGIANPDGARPRYRFEKVPTGGRWAARGVTGFGVLHDSMRFTADGIEQIITDAED